MDTFHLPKVGPNSSLVLVNSNSRRFEGNKIFYKVLPLGEKKLITFSKVENYMYKLKEKCFFCCDTNVERFVSMRNQPSDCWIPYTETLPMSFRDSTMS